MNLRVLLLPLLLALSKFASAAERPNILLILADDMGYGDLKAYNPNSKIPTPALDRLAAEGLRFTDAHTTGSTCIPARFGLLTGTYPHRQPSMRDNVPLIPEGMPTVASLLRGAGYRTAMIGKWHLGLTDKSNPVEGRALRGGPLDRGFDSFFGIHASTDIPPYYFIEGRLPTGMPLTTIEANNDDEAVTGWNRIQGAFWRGGGVGRNLSLPDVTPLFFEKALTFLTTKIEGDQPFFLYLPLPAPHTPWLPTPEFVGKSGAGSYGDFVMTVDDGIGQLLDQLDTQGIANNTLVLFTSDNGPVWLQKDVEKYNHQSAGPLRGMKGDNWEGGHRMPFLVRYPGTVPAGASTDQLVSFLDVSATLAELVGATANLPADSISFLPTLLGKESPAARTSVVHGKGKKFSFRDGRYKLLRHQGSAGFSKHDPKEGDPVGQLYDLEKDLGETINLWNDRPETVAELSRKLDRALAR